MHPTFDAVTRFIASLNLPLITTLSYLIDIYTPILYVISFVLFASTLRKEKRFFKAIITIIIALLIVFALKYYIQIPRPCTLNSAYIKFECPTAPDYSFPSGHTVISSAFLAPLVGTEAFMLFFALNLIVGFSRVNLGVHFVNDVLASFVIGFFTYDVVNRLFSTGTLSLSKPKNLLDSSFENRRQFLHIIIGALLIILVLVFSEMYGANGIVYIEFLAFIVLQFMLIIINDKMRGKESRISRILFSMFERTGVTPGYGAFWYGMGVLFSFVFIQDPSRLIAVIIALGIGDGIATIFGKGGKIQNPLNKSKTIEGSFAFFLSTAALSFPFIGFIAVPFAFITAIVEALPPKFDDNFMIPLVSIIFFSLF